MFNDVLTQTTSPARPRRMNPVKCLLATVAAGMLATLAGAGSVSAQPAESGQDATRSPEEVRRDRARNRLRDNRPAAERTADQPRDLPPIDPNLVDWYQTTVIELADPSYEGRSPGSAGIAKAADFIQARFEELELQPAFPVSILAADGTEVLDPNADFRQGFSVGQETRAVVTEMSIDGVALEHSIDFSALAYSDTGDVSAPVVFTGYSIVAGPNSFLGFDPNARFEGKIAMCLNYEPMDSDGNSLWRDEGFSHHAAITHKASALIRRGAEAVLIVTPPKTNDPRAELLETVDSTRVARPGLGAKAPKFDAPIVHITPDIAQRILDRTGNPDLTLETLIERSDRGPVYEELGELPVSVNIEMNTTDRDAFNIGAVLPGRGDLSREYIVIGAHYDHVGYGQQGSASNNATGELHPGADDNASGTTAMMLAAQLVKERIEALPDDAPHRSFLFLAFSAEEMGLLGSLHYTREPIVPLANHTLMLNLDMIGRLENDLLELGGLKSSRELEPLIDPLIEASGIPVARETSVGSGRSDHASFEAQAIPNMFFFTGLHADYHRPGDIAELIDFEGGTRIALLCAEIAVEAGTRRDRLVHRRDRDTAEQQNREPRVRLGILPANSGKGGVLVRRVFPDTSASSAGLQPDDRILNWDDNELKNTEDLRPRLVEHEPGDVVKLIVERGSEVIELEMTLRPIE
ncbi:MAG: M28 family peptidase [Phycisphaerales bacterium]